MKAWLSGHSTLIILVVLLAGPVTILILTAVTSYLNATEIIFQPFVP